MLLYKFDCNGFPPRCKHWAVFARSTRTGYNHTAQHLKSTNLSIKKQPARTSLVGTASHWVSLDIGMGIRHSISISGKSRWTSGSSMKLMTRRPRPRWRSQYSRSTNCWWNGRGGAVRGMARMFIWKLKKAIVLHVVITETKITGRLLRVSARDDDGNW